MAKGERRLTSKEKKFVAAYAGTSDARYAGTVAGYSQPHATSYEVLAKPAIRSEIVKVQHERLFSELLPAATDALKNILTDPKQPAGAKVQAAKLVLDRTLGIPGLENSKELHEMTADEIATRLDLLRKEANARRQAIDVEYHEIPAPAVFD